MIQINSTDVINNIDNYPLSFTVNGTTTNDPIVADTMHIGYIGSWKTGRSSQVRGAQGRVATKQTITIDSADVNQVVNPPAVDEYLHINLRVGTTNNESLYSRFQLVNGDTKLYQVKANSNLAGVAFLDDILVQIENAWKAEDSRYGTDNSPFTISFAGGVLTLVANDEHIYLEGIDIINENYDKSLVINLAYTETVPQFEGVGTGTYIQENVKLLTYPSTMPYGIAQDQLVRNTNDLYRMLSWFQTTDREELNTAGINGGEAKSKINHVLYINESAANVLGANNYIQNIARFISKGDALATFRDNAGAIIPDTTLGVLPGQTGYIADEAAITFAL